MRKTGRTVLGLGLLWVATFLLGQKWVRSETPAEPQVAVDTLQQVPDSLVDAEPLPRRLDRVVPNRAFDVGEKLTFVVRYGFIKAGYATMEVREKIVVNDSFPSYRIVSTARSTKTFDLIFKVRDEVESIVDARGIFSWRFTKKLREGGYKFDLFVNYDQLFGKAYVRMIRYHSDEPLRIKKQEEFVVPIPKYVLDVLAAFYYVRTQDLEVGVPVVMSNHDNRKVYDLQVIIQKKERIKVKAGTFDCIKVQPRLKGEAIFKQKGKLWVWLTDDERKLPVLMKSKVLIGSITTELIKIEGVPLPLEAQIK